MENKTIDIEPRAAVEMQTWENIYDRVPSQYKQYVSYPTTAMNECPSKSEIRDKFPESTTSSNELADYSSITLNFSEKQELNSDSLAENWLHNKKEQRDIQLKYGSTILCNNRVIHQNMNDYTGDYIYKKLGYNQNLFEVLALDKGLLRVRPLFGNITNMIRTCTVAVTAMGQTIYIFLSQDANPYGEQRQIPVQPTTPTSTN